jgi:predicted anti-sigma-YlaC factor YlaD
MWNLLKKNNAECERLRDSLEEAATKRAGVMSVEELIDGLPPAEREHLTSCEDCRGAAQDLVAAKELFQGVASFAEEARPWFAARVMNAITERERELSLRVSAWSEFPRFASRLALITAVVLLAGSTWLYEKAVKTPSYPLKGAGAQESIFEAPQQTNQDDVLIGMEESNP